MATSVKRSHSCRCQVLFLLALVLLAFVSASQSIDDGRKSKTTVVVGGGNEAIVDEDNDIFNGCHYNNQNPHYSSALFCCSKDKLCWASLPECAANCPCKTNC
ncbi:Ae3 [Zea mays]|uniref:Ae3 n=1 Tax=Zea mays TaxID=4577 RepID=A0A1D6J0G2_MAIZE|nr:Ae3 [Zea mays]